MIDWETRLQRIKPPSLGIYLLDLFFILLIIFMINSNFVFLPGVNSLTLPKSDDEEIIAASKLIVTVNQELAEDGSTRFCYAFNGQSMDSLAGIEGALDKELDNAARSEVGRGGEVSTAKIVLMADKDLPYQEIINFYRLAKKYNAQLFLVTDFTRQDKAFNAGGAK